MNEQPETMEQVMRNAAASLIARVPEAFLGSTADVLAANVRTVAIYIGAREYGNGWIAAVVPMEDRLRIAREEVNNFLNNRKGM